MPRITTRQAATSKPVRIAVSGLPTEWTTLLEAPDFSLPDSTGVWPDDADPAVANRRIQPGQVLIESPIMFYNSSASDLWIEVRILYEDGTEVVQARVDVPTGDTYLHPASGHALLKQDLTSTNGDRLQARAEVADVFNVSGAASEGSAEQHLPS